MTVYNLIANYEDKQHGHFFDAATLKFFGERISDMRVLKGTTVVKTYSGEEHTCYTLSSLQRKHPMGPRRKYSYFDTETFEHIITD